MQNLDVTTIHAPATGDNLTQGLVFLGVHYEKAFGVLPSPPDNLLVAQCGERIVGTIGVNVWQPDSGLRLARLYRLEQANVPIPNLHDTVEFGKWACEGVGISAHLVYRAICFSLAQRKTHVLCEHTTAVNRTARRFGIVFHRLVSAQLDSSMIEEWHRQFYEHNEPRVFFFELTQARAALEMYLGLH